MQTVRESLHLHAPSNPTLYVVCVYGGMRCAQTVGISGAGKSGVASGQVSLLADLITLVWTQPLCRQCFLTEFGRLTNKTPLKRIW